MNTPLVSICIPTYNGAGFLQDALDSVKSQTYRHIEVVVSDDDSKDDTLQIVDGFKREVEFPVKVVSHKPKGIGANWNNCIKHASGKYIKFLFQDDILLPACVEKMVAVMEGQPDLGLVGCKREFIIEDDKSDKTTELLERFGNLQAQFESAVEITFIDKSLFARKDFMDSPLNKIGEPPTVMFRKEIVKEVGYFDENLKQILDYVFYYRILKKYPIAIINEPLVKFRLHSQQATNVNSLKKVDEHEVYKKILHAEFLPLLHPDHKKKLDFKVSTFGRVWRRLKGG